MVRWESTDPGQRDKNNQRERGRNNQTEDQGRGAENWGLFPFVHCIIFITLKC